jgi:hypothetical protein
MTPLDPNDNDGAPVDFTAIRNLYSTDSAAKGIFDYFGKCKKNKRETSVARLHGMLLREGGDLTSPQVSQILRKLAGLNCGDFKIGRRGKPTRIEWKVKLVSLGQYASGQTTVLQNLDPETSEDDDEPVTEEQLSDSDHMNVTYPLRLDLMVGLSLPKNFTQKEANRLADFIRTLPFGDERVEAP